MSVSDDFFYLSKLSILYVEDDDSIREQLAQFLNRRCGALYLARDGQQGLDAFIGYQPDLIITDILMPVMDGLKMGEAIRGINPKVPIIITTAFEEPRYFQKAIDLDVDKYITKPVDLHALESALLKCARSIRGECALRELHDRNIELAEAQHIAKLGHWRLDVRTQQLAWSDELFCIFEIDKTGFDHAYQTFLNAIHPDDRDKVQQTFQAHLTHNAAYDIEHRIVLADGRIKYIHERCQTERDGEGQPLIALGTAQDITERKQVECELACYRQHLEELVMVRTSELLKAKEQAESANRAKSIFLANMSHELRTPLNAILGFTQLMERDEDLNAGHRSELQTINRAGRHLLGLINDVLEISRIEAGRVVLQCDTFDLAEMLVAIEEMIHNRANAKGLGFKLDRIGSLPRFVEGDAHHLRQVLINLLGNAIKYTDEGQVILRLVALGGQIRFEVEDTGIGIPPEEQQSIFQAFYQTQQGIAQGDGTGLGLAISQEFVHLMGGEITVASTLGRGSLFRFTLSLPESEEPTIEYDKGRIVGLNPEQTPVRVLVAEDNADNRELISRMLLGIGFLVFPASNGREAVEGFKTWQPDFIWMDMRMPALDGYAATRQIRALPSGDKVKIAALTASVFQEDKAEIFAAGCDAVLTKPIEEDKLFKLMGELLNLEYRYVSQTATEQKANGTLAKKLDLHAIDESLRHELQQAAEQLDVEVVQHLAAQFCDEHPELAAQLTELVDAYRFDKILELLKTPAATD